MRFVNLILLILVSLIITSCGSMIARMHRDMDADYARQQQERKQRQNKQFEMYRGKAPKQDNRLSSRTNPNVNPSIQRYYEENRPRPKKRYKANDLTDNSQDASLWSGSGNDNYLFSADKVRQVGDIVLINVQTKLRNELTMELKRVFPPPRPKKKKGSKEATPPPAPAPGEEEETKKDDDADKVHDRFTGIIIEEVNRDHILIKAQKNLLYNKRKHLIEIQALASRKDIMPDDTIDSNDFLEVSIEVLR